MDKRAFLKTAAFSLALPGAAPATELASQPRGPVLLTISGDVARPNRGGIDPALDQLMAKQGVEFRQARTFDYAELEALPAVEIRPTLEYDSRPHTLRGPLLVHLFDLAGWHGSDSVAVTMRGFDGYTVDLPFGELRKLQFIVATHLDHSPIPLGGLGPLWAVFDADRFPGFAARPLPERFANCPWGLYSIHVAESQD